MSLTVRIHFTGLCSFIPEKPIGEPENEAVVVLVNAERSAHAVHDCLVFAKNEQYPLNGNRAPTFAFQYSAGGTESVLVRGCRLRGEVLTMVGHTSTHVRITPQRRLLTFTLGNRLPEDACPEDGTASDFDWVLPNPYPVRRDILSSNSLADLVNVRMRLTQGNLACESFRVDKSRDRLIRWNFGDEVSRAIAEEVVYEFTFPEDSEVTSVVFESMPFEGFPEQPDLVLTPEDDEVDAWIVNMPLASLLEVDPPRPYDPDHHYLEFYRLCKREDVPPDPPIPIPDLHEFCVPLTAASNPKCPPTYFTSVTQQFVEAQECPQGPLVKPSQEAHRHR